MAKEEESGSVQRKVFHVMVECLQNISKHADDFAANDFLYSGRGIFMVCKGETEYTVTTGNAIDNSRMKILPKCLIQLIHMDKEELNEIV